MRHNIQNVVEEMINCSEFSSEQKQAANEHGLEFLSKGLERFVFSTGKNTVIKIVKNESLKIVNKNEAVAYFRIEDPTLLCPVINHGPEYKWIEMKRCEPAPERIDEYWKKLEESSLDICDIHRDNIGVLSEQDALVCYDYPSVTV